MQSDGGKNFCERYNALFYRQSACKCNIAVFPRHYAAEINGEAREKEDNFILNYFVPIRKKGIKLSYLKDIMIQKIQDEDYDSFQLLSDKISEYYFTSYKYRIKEDGKCIFEKDSPIELKDIVNYGIDTHAPAFRASLIHRYLYFYLFGGNLLQLRFYLSLLRYPFITID